MPSAANFARPIRARERIDLETCAPGSSHGPPLSFDLPQTWSFHLCGRSASGCQSASEAIGEAPKRWRCVFQERAGHSRVDHRTFLGAANCGYRSAGSNAFIAARGSIADSRSRRSSAFRSPFPPVWCLDPCADVRGMTCLRLDTSSAELTFWTFQKRPDLTARRDDPARQVHEC